MNFKKKLIFFMKIIIKELIKFKNNEDYKRQEL